MNKQEKIQELYSLRNQLYNKLVDMTIIPEDVVIIIKNAFQKLEEWYRVQDWYKTQDYESTIDEYINGNYEETKADINSRRGNDRRGIYWGQINHLFDVLEEKISQGEVLSQSEVEKFIIQDDEREKMSVLNYIVNELTEKLKDVQMRNRSLMTDRGFSDEQILKENFKTMEFIKKCMVNKEDEIAEIYKKRENKLTNDVVSALTEIIKAINSCEITPQNDFRRDLNVTDELTYDQQNAHSREFSNKQQDKEPEELELPSLPTDLIQ